MSVKMTIAAGVASAALLLAGCGSTAEPQPQPPTSVVTEQPQRELTGDVRTPKRSEALPGLPSTGIPSQIDAATAVVPRGLGPIWAVAVVQAPDGSVRNVTRQLPANVSDARAQAVLAALSEIPGVVAVDFETSPIPLTNQPNDPRWYPSTSKPNLQLPLSRIGLCCSNDGRPDAWRLAELRMARGYQVNGAFVAHPDVNVAVVDSGLMSKTTQNSAAVIEADLKSRFIGGWDGKNNKGAGLPWDQYPKSDVDDDQHGTAVAGYLLATANNGSGSAGAAGAQSNVKFGAFRVFGRHQKVGGNIVPIPNDGWATSGALQTILDHVDRFQTGKPGGIDWPIINMSLGAPGPTAAQEYLMRRLEEKGVLIVVAAGNQRTSYMGGGTPDAFGINPILWPAGSAFALSVAAWGGGGENGKYTDQTAVYSSVNQFVDIAAPGTALPSIGAGYYANSAGNGTSYASPTMAGIAATLIATATTTENLRCTRIGINQQQRLDCLSNLRQKLLAATMDITNANENLDTMGAGLVDAASMMLGRNGLGGNVPAPPKNFRLTNAQLTKTDGKRDTYKVQFDWDQSADASQYQFFVNGASATLASQVPGVVFDAAATKPQYNAATGVWTLPKSWTSFQIPWQPIPANTPTVTTEVTLTRDFDNYISLTAKALFGNGRRAAESMDASLACESTAKGAGPVLTCT